MTHIAGAIPKESRGDCIAIGLAEGVAFVAARKRGAKGDGDALPDKGVSTQQVVLLGKEVHRAATTLAAASGLAKQFTHHLARWNPAAEGVDVVAVGAAKPIVLALHRANHPRAHGLLTVVEMDESEHLAPVVHLGALVFKTSA